MTSFKRRLICSVPPVSNCSGSLFRSCSSDIFTSCCVKHLSVSCPLCRQSTAVSTLAVMRQCCPLVVKPVCCIFLFLNLNLPRGSENWKRDLSSVPFISPRQLWDPCETKVMLWLISPVSQLFLLRNRCRKSQLGLPVSFKKQREMFETKKDYNKTDWTCSPVFVSRMIHPVLKV